MMTNKSCKTCKWHDDFSWACFNGDSENRADFTSNDDKCDFWEMADFENSEKIKKGVSDDESTV
jgi:hypothetical protein